MVIEITAQGNGMPRTTYYHLKSLPKLLKPRQNVRAEALERLLATLELVLAVRDECNRSLIVLDKSTKLM